MNIELEPMPQPFTVYVDGEPVFRDAISFADRQGKTTAQKQAIAQARYEAWLEIANTPTEGPEEADVVEEG